VLAGFPKLTIAPLQRVQNAAARRLITGIGRHDHETTALRKLHWLPIPYIYVRFLPTDNDTGIVLLSSSFLTKFIFVGSRLAGPDGAVIAAHRSLPYETGQLVS